MPAEEDLVLVRSCLRGRDGAWEALVARVMEPLSRIARRILMRYRLPAGAGEVSDLVQEVLGELLDRDRAALRAYTGRASLEAYLAAIASHRAYRLAGERRLLPLEGEGPADPGADPAERLDLQERGAGLQEALGRLSPRDRLSLRLQMEGAPAAEVARVLKVNTAHARVILARARERLRPLLGKSAQGL